MFIDAFKTIEKSVVGIGIRNDPEYTIFGTGFVVSSSGWIMTNRHVIESLLVPDSQSGEMRMRKGAAAFLFVDAPPPTGLTAARGMAVTDLVQAASFPVKSQTDKKEPPDLHGIKVQSVVPAAAPDIAVCQIDPTNLPPQFKLLHSAKIVNSAHVKIGQTVGTLGFPQGVKYPLTFESTAEIQLCPLLQTGVIAGMLPYPGLAKPTSFVLDIVVNPGSSGSPMFLPNGDVVGVVFATRMRFCELLELDEVGDIQTSNDKGVQVVSGLGLAVPSAHLPKEWLK